VGLLLLGDMLLLSMSLNQSKRNFINKDGKAEEIYREYRVNYKTLFNREAEEEMIKSLHKAEALCKLIKYAFNSKHLISIKDDRNYNQYNISVPKDESSDCEFYVNLGKKTHICHCLEWQYMIVTDLNSVELLDSTFDMYFERVSQLRKAVNDKAKQLFQNSRGAFVVKEEYEKTNNLIFEIDEISGEFKTYEKKCKFIIDNETEVAFYLKFNKEKDEFFIDSFGPISLRDKKSRDFLCRI